MSMARQGKFLMKDELGSMAARVADLALVERRIDREVRNPAEAERLKGKVRNYVRTRSQSDDLTPSEAAGIYRDEDFGEEVPLSNKRDLDIEWSGHAEYRSDLRDVKPDAVNEAVRKKMRLKLEKGDKLRGKDKLVEPGLGTMVVDYDLTSRPADADVITVWAGSGVRAGLVDSIVEADRKTEAWKRGYFELTKRLPDGVVVGGWKKVTLGQDVFWQRGSRFKTYIVEEAGQRLVDEVLARHGIRVAGDDLLDRRYVRVTLVDSETGKRKVMFLKDAVEHGRFLVGIEVDGQGGNIGSMVVGERKHFIEKAVIRLVEEYRMSKRYGELVKVAGDRRACRVAFRVLAKDRPEDEFAGKFFDIRQKVRGLKEKWSQEALESLQGGLEADLKEAGYEVILVKLSLGQYRGSHFITSAKVQVKVVKDSEANEVLKKLQRYSPKYTLKSVEGGVATFNIR